jgi:GNAT superfamily N-acetyltransferase
MIMALATWWQGDPLPELPPLPSLSVCANHTVPLLAQLVQVSEEEIQSRLQTGHTAFLAYWDEEPVAYGWVATQEATIGEVSLSFSLETTDHYLWDFATLPAWRGHGIYPHLLQQIIQQQSDQVARFWILFAPENRASAAGILKAGFRLVTEISFTRERTVSAAALESSERAQSGARLLGITPANDLSTGMLAPCWRCGGIPQDAACWPRVGPVKACTCS